MGALTLSPADAALQTIVQSNTIRSVLRALAARPRHLLLAVSGCRALEWLAESGGAGVVHEMLVEGALATCAELLRLQRDRETSPRRDATGGADGARDPDWRPRVCAAAPGASRATVRGSWAPGVLGSSLELSGPLSGDAGRRAAEEMRAALRESGLLRVVKETLARERGNETAVVEETQLVATLCDDSGGERGESCRGDA